MMEISLLFDFKQLIMSQTNGISSSKLVNEVFKQSHLILYEETESET